MTIRWFFSKSVRQLAEMCSQMQRMLHEQRDLLKPDAIAGIQAAGAEARAALQSGTKPEQLKEQMGKLENAAKKWFLGYANPGMRENIKELLVAIVTILSFTTFFLQLTKIPTGSMQPTLYGITHEDLRGTTFEMPSFLKRLAIYWTQGISYKHLVAPEDGQITGIESARIVIPFVKKQRIFFNRQPLTVWFPGDDLEKRAQLYPGMEFRKGQDIVKMKLVTGDHLLVDRFTYNFRNPERGEIIVFKTKGIAPSQLQQDVLYIKRLVALPNEEVRLGNDRHLIINGERLDASTLRFEMVYSFDLFPKNNPYLGHVNEAALRELNMPAYQLSPLLPDESVVHKVGPAHYMAMGDNTLNSLDSRSWGDLPQKNVIGKCWFIYWPFTSRFGWGYR